MCLHLGVKGVVYVAMVGLGEGHLFWGMSSDEKACFCLLAEDQL